MASLARMCAGLRRLLWRHMLQHWHSHCIPCAHPCLLPSRPTNLGSNTVRALDLGAQQSKKDIDVTHTLAMYSEALSPQTLACFACCIPPCLLLAGLSAVPHPVRSGCSSRFMRVVLASAAFGSHATLPAVAQ